MKSLTWGALLNHVGLLRQPVLITLALSGCISTEQIKEKAYNHVLEELKADGHPTGMFGVTWYMTQQDVNTILDDLYQLSDDTLAHERIYYERPVQVSYQYDVDAGWLQGI